MSRLGNVTGVGASPLPNRSPVPSSQYPRDGGDGSLYKDLRQIGRPQRDSRIFRRSEEQTDRQKEVPTDGVDSSVT